MSKKLFDSPASLQEELLAMISARGDLPGFSSSVNAIVAVLAENPEEDRDDLKLIQIVLTDASLTQKVLRLANSAMYAVFEGQVTTVSRAVAILGIQTVAHLALGLKVVESFQSDDKSSTSIRDEMNLSMLAGVLGRQFAACSAGTRDAEEASVVSVLHGLGKMLVAFYLPEAWAAVDSKVKNGATTSAAALEVMSISFESIGQFIATRWGLPPKLVTALRAAPDFDQTQAMSHEDWLCTIGVVASEGATLLYHDKEESAAMDSLISTFGPRLGLDESQLRNAISTAKSIVSVTSNSSTVGGRLVEENRDRALATGLAELKKAAKTSSLSQTVALAVEFLHQALGSSRSYYFLKSTKDRMYKARLGLGKGAVELLPSLKFDEQFKPDVFHAAMASQKSCYVENAKSPAIKFRLPLWWLASLGAAEGFCIVPMNTNLSPLGFIYLEWAAASNHPKLEGYAIEVLSEVKTIIAESIERSRQSNAMATQQIAA